MIRTAIFLLSAAPLALTAATAHAQTAPEAATAAQDAAPVADEAPIGEDIVVVGTAGGGTRRQDAAFAVTTLSNDAIERAAPNSTADILRTVPGVMAESSGGQNGANIFVRGYPSGGDAQFVTFQLGGVPIFPPPTLSFLENSQLIRLDETVRAGRGRARRHRLALLQRPAGPHRQRRAAYRRQRAARPRQILLHRFRRERAAMPGCRARSTRIPAS